MTTFKFTRFLAGAATAVALTIAVSGSALAKGGGGMGGGHMSGGSGIPAVVTGNGGNGTVRLGGHDGHHFGFTLGYAYPSTVCFYRWTNLGRVRICPNYGY
jgi:hypothetical protein